MKKKKYLGNWTIISHEWTLLKKRGGNKTRISVGSLDVIGPDDSGRANGSHIPRNHTVEAVWSSQGKENREVVY